MGIQGEMMHSKLKHYIDGMQTHHKITVQYL
jgi:hypothetical protein